MGEKTCFSLYRFAAMAGRDVDVMPDDHDVSTMIAAEIRQNGHQTAGRCNIVSVELIVA